jgi:hypothetical protein
LGIEQGVPGPEVLEQLGLAKALDEYLNQLSREQLEGLKRNLLVPFEPTNEEWRAIGTSAFRAFSGRKE